MVAIKFKTLALLLMALSPSVAQTKPFVGTVAGFNVDTAEIQIKPDNGELVSMHVTAGTQVQRVPPGEKDLKKAEPVKITEIGVGDRVLVTPMPDPAEARRIVVMSSSDIAKRNEADGLDWNKRGVMGIVAAKKAGEITLRMRSLQGERTATVTVSDTTRYRRYTPDSVKFADAKNSSLAEIIVGDQLRARGQKSEDGLKVTAEEVVFGTFQTKAGQITAVNVETKEITVKELSSSRPLVIKVAGDSQIKKMPNFAAMMPGGPPGAAVGMRPPGGGAPDLSQMLERMPPAKLEDLKTGETVVVSSTKGASVGQITAIMLVSNADMLIRIASMQSGGGARPGAGNAALPSMGMGGMGGVMGGMGGGLGGLDLGGLTQ